MLLMLGMHMSILVEDAPNQYLEGRINMNIASER